MRGPRVSETAFAKVESAYVAYQVVGEGPRDLRGSHELKGVPGEWRLFAVRS